MHSRDSTIKRRPRHPSDRERQLTETQQRAAGIRPEQIRLSVGTEDVGDLLGDLDRALALSAG